MPMLTSNRTFVERPAGTGAERQLRDRLMPGLHPEE